MAVHLALASANATVPEQDLPADERKAVLAILRQLDFYGEELHLADADLSGIALERAEVRRLMTIPGVDATVALAIIAGVGDFPRFPSPGRLVSYMGLNPRVHQSGGQPASHGIARPSLTAQKLRALELRAGMPARRGQKGNAASYSLKEVRRRERELSEQAEHAYRQLIANWLPKGSRTAEGTKVGVVAATGARLSGPQRGRAARQGLQPQHPALRFGVDHARG